MPGIEETLKMKEMILRKTEVWQNDHANTEEESVTIMEEVSLDVIICPLSTLHME